MMNTHRTTLLLVLLATLSVLAADANADGTVSLYKTTEFYRDDSVRADDDVRFVIRMHNTTGVRSNVSNGFRISSPDGATWDSVSITGIGEACPNVTASPYDDYCWFLSYFDMALGLWQSRSPGVTPDTVGFLGAGNPTNTDGQLPIGFNDSTFAVVVWLNSNPANYGKQLCIDSAFWGTAGTWVWVDNDIVRHYPDWQGNRVDQPHQPGYGYCFTLGDPATMLDWDNDGVTDDIDNCYYAANPGQENTDGDAFGDACDPWPLDPQNDIDNDSVSGHIDNCPVTYNPSQADANSDGIGDACCCEGITGNINVAGIIDGGDLALLVAYLTNAPGQKPIMACPGEANVNGAGIVDGSDLALLVAYLTNPPLQKPTLPNCP